MKKTDKKRAAALTREDMEHTVRELALASARLDEIQGRMNEELARVRETYEPDIAALRESYDGHEAVALEWAKAHPEEFIPRKSIVLVHGVIGFRTGQPTLKLLAGLTWESVIKTLRSSLPAYVRVKEEVDKAGLLAARDEVGKERLAAVGLRVEQKEEAYVDPNKESLQPAC